MIVVNIATLYTYPGHDLVEDLIQLVAGAFVPLAQSFLHRLCHRTLDDALDFIASRAGWRTKAGFVPSKERRVGNGPGPSRGPWPGSATGSEGPNRRSTAAIDVIGGDGNITMVMHVLDVVVDCLLGGIRVHRAAAAI